MGSLTRTTIIRTTTTIHIQTIMDTDTCIAGGDTTPNIASGATTNISRYLLSGAHWGKRPVS